MEGGESQNLFNKGKKKIENAPQHNTFFNQGVGPDVVVENNRAWNVYGNGAHGPEGYFGGGLDSFQEIINFREAKAKLRSLKEEYQGMNVVVLDVMGQGEIGIDLDADISIGWTYKDHKEVERDPKCIVVEGDLYERGTQRRHMEDLRTLLSEKNAFLGAVFFRSIGGYATERDNLFANAILYERYFKKLYNMAPVGALFYLNINFSGSYGEQLQSFLLENGYALLTNPEKSRNCSILIKTNGKPSLPTITKILPHMEALVLSQV